MVALAPEDPKQTKEVAPSLCYRWRSFLGTPSPAPAYQRLAAAVADLRLNGWSDHSIAVEFGVTGKTIAKAIRWLRA